MQIETALVFTHQRGSGNLVYLADKLGEMSSVCTAEWVVDVNKETETVERKGINLGAGGFILNIGSAAGVRWLAPS